MKRFFLLSGIAMLVILLACIAGCTSTTSSPAVATPAATAPAATPAASAPSGAVTAAATPASAGVDTKVQVHFNDFACLDIQKALGVEYLYPGEKYTVWVNTPGSISPNLLVLDVTDNTKLGAVKPVWDSIQKTWQYEGILPMVKIFDVTSPQSKTLTIKDQGKYYLCIDDRKEIGTSDAIYQVPVKVTRA